MKDRLRHVLHEIYYKLTPPSGVDFAMSCKQVTGMIDLRKKSRRWVDRFRLWLHLSICQACNNYFKSSQALRRILSGLINESERSVDLNKLNRELLKKHGKNH